MKDAWSDKFYNLTNMVDILIQNDPTGYQEVNDYSDEPKLFIELSNISLKLFMETIDTVMIDQ